MKRYVDDHQGFVQTVQEDKEFSRWVDDVSPRSPSGVQQVWIAELFLVLKILWEIYQILKALGWFKGWWETRKVKRAMRGLTATEKENALLKVRDSLIHETQPW